MSGASFAHNFITMNTANQLYNQLIGGECQVAASDMRVKVAQAESYFYPDIVVVCGEPLAEDDAFRHAPESYAHRRNPFSFDRNL